MWFNDRRKSAKAGKIERAQVRNFAEKDNPFVSRKERYATAARAIDAYNAQRKK